MSVELFHQIYIVFFFLAYALGGWRILAFQHMLFSSSPVLFSAARLSVIHNKDLLATIHLLVAMVRCFQPEVDLPPNVKVEVVVVEVSSSFIASLCAPRTHPGGFAPKLWFSSRSAVADLSHMWRQRS